MKAADDTVRAVLEAEEREKRRETRVDPLPAPEAAQPGPAPDEPAPDVAGRRPVRRHQGLRRVPRPLD